MDSVDLDVLKIRVRWLQQGRGVVLATVVSTWGSPPRPVGALLVTHYLGQARRSMRLSGADISQDIGQLEVT